MPVSTPITELKPALIWKHFHGLTQQPRPSKKEEKVIAYLKALVTELGYSYSMDACGNMLVRKPATPGFENAPTVLIQGHVDMVCEKNKGTEHDFDNDPIQTIIDGDWVRARGTTLGADNGIGVAAALAVLEAKDLAHPPMEFLFTIDEETGLTGAKGLKAGFVNADIMLNLDSEEDGALYVGCSGGMDSAGVLALTFENAPAGYSALEITVSGLKGGHSGLDIHTGRGNAIRFLVRALSAFAKDTDVRLASISGGSKRNAIPREAECVVYVPAAAAPAIIEKSTTLTALFLNEIGSVEPTLLLAARATEGSGKVIAAEQVRTLIDVLHALPHGVLKMSADIPGLVETSTNLATVTMDGNTLTIGTSQRSSVESEKFDAVDHVTAVLRLAGLNVVLGDGYPGWKPNMQSLALKVTRDSYKQLYGVDPEIKAIHAGLECGLIGEVYPKMDMISFGPTIMGAHSPDECLQISTVDKFWNLVVRVLENTAKNAAA
ncbi:MAG: aminoacyl-histidine dipeptidase [Ignavibacteria bacterium]|nr:aminoacyl-histidine dipeptidase [Ignavibacteria bacterium]